MKKFDRPSTIYYKFKALDIDNSTIVKYYIQDFPQNRFDDGVKFMLEHFVTEEPTLKARDIRVDKLAVLECTRLWREILSQNTSLACFKEGSEEIIAMNLLTVRSVFDDDSEKSEDEDRKIMSKDLSDILTLHTVLEKHFDPLKFYKVESYLYSCGLAVHKNYKRRGIATEMLKVRPKLMKSLGLKVTTSHFIGTAAQYAAVKACYEENYVISYDELYKMNTNFYFSGMDSPTVKVMSLVLP